MGPPIINLNDTQLDIEAEICAVEIALHELQARKTELHIRAWKDYQNKLRAEKAHREKGKPSG
jgi:hypothetical protein